MFPVCLIVFRRENHVLAVMHSASVVLALAMCQGPSQLLGDSSEGKGTSAIRGLLFQWEGGNNHTCKYITYQVVMRARKKNLARIRGYKVLVQGTAFNIF